MYKDEVERVPVSEWKFSDFYLAISFITEGENFEQLVVGLTTDLQGKLDRHFPTSVRFFCFRYFIRQLLYKLVFDRSQICFFKLMALVQTWNHWI